MFAFIKYTIFIIKFYQYVLSRARASSNLEQFLGHVWSVILISQTDFSYEIKLYNIHSSFIHKEPISGESFLATKVSVQFTHLLQNTWRISKRICWRLRVWFLNKQQLCAVGYLVYDRKIGSVYDQNALYNRFFHFAMFHFLKIDVNDFVVNCHFYQWISGVNYTENKRFWASIMNAIREIVNYF